MGGGRPTGAQRLLSGPHAGGGRLRTRRQTATGRPTRPRNGPGGGPVAAELAEVLTGATLLLSGRPLRARRAPVQPVHLEGVPVRPDGLAGGRGSRRLDTRRGLQQVAAARQDSA